MEMLLMTEGSTRQMRVCTTGFLCLLLFVKLFSRHCGEKAPPFVRHSKKKSLLLPFWLSMHGGHHSVFWKKNRLYHLNYSFWKFECSLSPLQSVKTKSDRKSTKLEPTDDQVGGSPRLCVEDGRILCNMEVLSTASRGRLLWLHKQI